MKNAPFTAEQFISISILSLSCFAQNISGQSPNEVPSEAYAQKLLTERIQTESSGAIRLSSFAKTDGQKSEVFGIQMYEMDYTLEIEFVESCRWLEGKYLANREFIDRGFRT